VEAGRFNQVLEATMVYLVRQAFGLLREGRLWRSWQTDGQRVHPHSQRQMRANETRQTSTAARLVLSNECSLQTNESSWRLRRKCACARRRCVGTLAAPFFLHANERSFLLVAPTVADRNAWMAVLKRVNDRVISAVSGPTRADVRLCCSRQRYFVRRVND
jgi:hypothetical protein